MRQGTVASRLLVGVLAGAALVLALAAPLHAQGKSNGKGNGGNGNGHKSSPPSSSPLPSQTTNPAVGASPLAWLDDASVLAPGFMSVTISTMRWSGADLAEVSFPIVEADVGLTSRVQIGATVPRIVGGPDGTDPVGGVGTSYISSKIALLSGRHSGIKLAVSPVLEVLSKSAVQALPSAEGRVQVGVPVSTEFAQGPTRVFASTGFFSRGVWFAGGGVAVQATPKVGTSFSFTRSWANDGTTGVSRDRRELSGGVSYSVRPNVAVYGALGRTISTTDADGAGTTISGGVSIFFNARAAK